MQAGGGSSNESADTKDEDRSEKIPNDGDVGESIETYPIIAYEH